MKMNNVLHKFIVLFLFVLCPILLWATPSVTVRVTAGTCLANGVITVTATNVTGTASYGLRGNNNEIYEIVNQTSNVFNDLPAGTYTVSVYDQSTGATPVTASATITTTYKAFTMNVPTASMASSQYCADNGSLTISVVGGKSPYRYRIRNTTTNDVAMEREHSTISTALTISGLSTGQYYAEVEDACGELRITTSTIAVTSSGSPLKGIEFTSLDFTPYSGGYYGNGACDKIYVSGYFSSSFKINGSTALSMAYYNAIKYCIEYPAYSGNYSAWNTSFYSINFPITGYDPTNPGQYRILAQHPCTGATVVSPAYTLPSVTMNFSYANYLVYNDYCNLPTEAVVRLSLSTTGVSNYVCDNFSVEVTPQSGGTTQTYTWAGGTYYDIKGLSPATSYNIVVKSNNTVLKTLSVTTISPSLTGYMTATVNPAINSSNYYGYNFGRTCDFNTTAIYAYYSVPTTSYTLNRAHEITYSIESGPVTRDPITITAAQNASSSYLILWSDLPYGVYQIKIDYGCRQETKTVTLTKVVTGFGADEPTYTTAAVCGQYTVSGKGYFLNMSGVPYTTTSSAYMYYMMITNTVTNATYSTYAYSNYTASISGLGAGKYKVQYYAYYNHLTTATRCYYKEQELILPDYISPTVNIPLSGGITCGGEENIGKLTITANGSRPPFRYRFKREDADDNTYSAWQNSNVFENLISGRFKVQIVDNCGSVTSQNLSIYSGNDQFVALIGSIDETTVCETKPVQLSVLSVGPVNSYKWLKNGDVIDDATGPVYNIESAQQSDMGIYTVVINNGLCELQSSVEINRVLPVAETPTITGACVLTGASTVLTAQTTVALPSYQWYKDKAIVSGAVNKTYTATSPGIYSVIVTPKGACPSTPSDPFILSLPVLYWKGTANDDNWNNPENWVTPSGSSVTVIPSQCTEVHIPGGLLSYPSLDPLYTFTEGYGNPVADKIIFHFGGELAYQHLLTYNKAYIQYNWGYYAGNNTEQPQNNLDGSACSMITRDKWYMLAAPLKKMASGDFALAGYPLTWQSLYNAPHPLSGNLVSGDFSTPFASNDIDLSTTNNALAVKVACYNPNIGYNDHTNLEGLKGILEIPYFENSNVLAYHPGHTYNSIRKESRFYYFNEKTLKQLASPIGVMSRSDEAYRFVYEDNITKKAPNINVQGENVPAYSQHVTSGASTSNTVMIGNPFMASINSRLFFEANRNVLNEDAGYYLLTPTNQVWARTEYKLENKISALQAFVITLADGLTSADIVYPLEGNYALTGNLNDAATNNIRSLNALSFRSKSGNLAGSDYAILNVNQQNESVGVRKMVYPDSHAVSEAFIISPDQEYSLIEFLSKGQNEIGIGVKSSNQKDVLSLEFDNVSSFTYATGLTPILVDKHLKIEQDLTAKNVYSFNQRETDPKKQYADTDRFSLRLASATSGIIDETGDEGLITVIYAKNQLEVRCEDGLTEIDVYDLQGRRLHNSGKLVGAPTVYNKGLVLNQGAYIVKVKTSLRQIVSKKINAN